MTRNFRTLLTLIVVGVAIIPVLVLTYPFTSLVSNAVQRNAARETALIAEGLARDLQADLKMLVAQALALSRDSDIQRATRTVLFANKAAFLMKRFLEDNSLSESAYLVDEILKLNAAIPANPSSTLSQEKVTAILRLAENEYRAEIPDALGYFNWIATEEVFVLAVPVQGPLDRPTGLLLIEIPYKKLQEKVAARVQQPALARLVMGRAAPAPVLSKDFIGEAEVLIAGFEPQKELALSVTVLEPMAIRLGAVRQTVRWMILSSILLALIAGAAGYYLAWRLNRPFKRLNEHLKKYESGDYGAKVPIFTINEFSQIAATLDSMARKIAEQIQLAAENERVRGEVERVRLETELHSLHQQMQPHFLFNTLNSIGAMIHIDADRATGLVNKFSDLYRLILEMNRTNTVLLDKELTVISHYLELQEMRFGERLRYSIACDPGLLRTVHVPGLMLQTLVENAVKHGIAKSLEGGEVRVSVIQAGDELFRCEIVNTGGALVEKEGGTGLANTRRRLALLYGEAHGFVLQTGAAGETVASFTFSGRCL
ncbi:MAG: hypothetical protein A2X94_09050 [Bdellovibrionales bacterium GWB1_55_8]|nr:MAG: hypothetical protein A2X94_09050 [Bdellovibrionales bacterium GWB1_55_8]